MPSPRWSQSAEAPLFQALAAAQHAAFRTHSPEAARRAFADTLRSLVGPGRSDQILSAALSILNEQLRAPQGFEEPPGAQFEICPRCQQMKRTKFTNPQHGRLKLAVLRDREWLQRQFEAGRSCVAIAEQLECSHALVVDWARKHELAPPRTARSAETQAEVERMHIAGMSPGEIGKALEIPAQDVKERLAKAGLANSKFGHHHFNAEWWIERIERRGWTATQCARAAGIRPHATVYYTKRFGLDHITKANATKKGARRWSLKYPQLADPKQLQALLDEHGSYEAVAKIVGCHPTLVSSWARKVLGADKRHENHLPHSAKSWWIERLKRGATIRELAEEAGIAEKSVLERLRRFGPEMLGWGYRNNTAAERAKRSIAAASSWAKPRAANDVAQEDVA